jgi:signal transduction histidine kinase
MTQPRGNILIVDDEPENVRLLGSLLAGDGFDLHVAHSGEQALEILDALRGEVYLDVILVDILMPGGMSGIETCRRIKSRADASSAPMIFLTGKDDSETMLEAFAAGGADYVLKPFNADVLLARVRAHSQLARLSRDLATLLWERTAELRDANAKLQRLAREICFVEEEEKKRLAGELHDSPMQKLALAQLQIAAAAKHRDAESDRALAVGLDLLRDALQELRTLQFELSPPLLRQEGLGAALRWFTAQTAQRFGLELPFVESGSCPPLRQDLSLILFQCARELVHNVVKHSGASRCRLELHYEQDAVRLVVSDNGKGFVPDAVGPRLDGKGGYGLRSLRERLGLWGGSLSIDSDGSGTRATVRVPDGSLAEPASEHGRRVPEPDRSDRRGSQAWR